MSRHVKEIRIADNNRDHGKLFVITEMSARDAHRWATRAIFAMLASGVAVPDELLQSGLAGIATLGVKMLGGASYDAMGPLLEELLTCVQVRPDPSRPDILRNDFGSDVEEAKTFFLLQKEALMLHIEPFITAVKSGGISTAAAPRAA